MVIRAYPEDVLKELESNSAQKPNTDTRVVYIYTSNPDEWNYIIKALIIIGTVIILAYVAKKLLE